LLLLALVTAGSETSSWAKNEHCHWISTCYFVS
jgi:hypothetical protein